MLHGDTRMIQFLGVYMRDTKRTQTDMLEISKYSRAERWKIEIKDEDILRNSLGHWDHREGDSMTAET